MIPPALLGVALSLDPARRARVREVLRERTGSEWIEMQVAIKLRRPDLWPDAPLLDPVWWLGDPQGFLARQIIDGMQRHEHLTRLARNLTPEQHAQLWQDPSPQAAELRRFLRGRVLALAGRV